MPMYMFLLFSIVFAKKYCVERYDGQCEKKCKHLQETFDEIFHRYLPYFDNDPNNTVHDIYVADDINFHNINHNIISCDPSIILTINGLVSSIIIKDYIYADSMKIPNNFTTLINIYNNFELTVATDEKSNIGPIILYPNYNNKECRIHFANDFIPENLISIHPDFYNINLPYKTDSILKLFKNTEKLSFYSYDYQYCLSDKEIKCKGYTQNSLTMINSTSQINHYPCILIVDTSDHQYLDHDYYYTEYIHIIALPGSDISFNCDQREYNNYVFLNGKSVDTYSFHFEGDGKLTLIMDSNFTIHSAGKTNDIHLKLKSKYPFKVDRSHISALTDDSGQILNNKIQVEQYSQFYGPKSLLGLFEPGKYICEEDFLNYNVTVSDLKEYPYDRLTYYFAKGEHEFPTKWRIPCDLYAIDNNETTFIFNDVYSFVGSDIDSFISINDASIYRSMITIKPAHYFYLSSFELKKNAKYNKKYTIQVEKDFKMSGYIDTYNYYIGEYSQDQCKIVGNGTIKFSEEYFMKYIKRLCDIDEGIELKYEYSYDYKARNICIGQSDLESCKSEISGIETFEGTEWSWIRNIRTLNHYFVSYDTIYFTDKLEFFNDVYDYTFYCSSSVYHDYNVVLTPNSSLTIPYKHINMYKNKINKIEAQNSSAKLTYLYTDVNCFQDCGKSVFQIYYYDAPSDIDFQVYFYNENVKLYMRYLENFTEKSIKLNGTSVLHIREPYITRIPIFSRPDTLNIRINEDECYHQLCYSYKPIEYNDLYDFLLCPNYETLVELDNATWTVNGIYVFYLNISLTLNSNSYRCKYFHFFDNITVECDLPNNPILKLAYNSFEIINEYNYHFNYHFEDSYPTKFIYDVKDTIVLDYIYSSQYPLIEFSSLEKSVEVIPSYTIRTLKLYENRRIKIPNSFSIYSPAPHYLYDLFNSTSIYFSTRWNYLYINESGKSFYETILDKSNTLDKYNPEENTIKNVVLAVGNNEIVTIPSNWDDSINVFILQDEVAHIDRPLNLSFSNGSVILNHKFKIIVGDMNITLPESFTVDAYMLNDNRLYHYLYQTILDCSQNERTDLFTDSIIVEWSAVKVVDIYRNNDSKLLQINVQNESDMHDLNLVLNLNSDNNVKYHFLYDYICYAYSKSRCHGKFFYADTFLGLYHAMQDYPELNITIADDIYIPYTTGDHFILNPIYEDIKIDLPQYPDSLNIMKNNIISFNYSDSTLIDIINKSIINVDLMNYIDIEFEADTDSSITFTLQSDVFVSTKSNFVPNFSISVINNSYHLYSDDVKLFGNMFNGLLESYIKMCAYGTNASSLCSFTMKNTIENIFKDPFDCNEVEIALLSTPYEIKLPSVSHSVFLNILSSSTTTLTIQEVSDVQIIPEFVIINEKWHFDGNISVLSLKLNPISSLSISDQIKMPITFQLTSKETFIDLKDFDEQNSVQINILKYGDEANKITVFGSNETYHNFINAVKHEGIEILHNGTQKYLCICKNEESCNQCKDGIEGIIIPTYEVKNDPGEDVKIRIFSDIEIPSKIFTNEHDVLINYNYTINITNIDTVYQNIESGLKIDNLIFVNGTNVLLKPTDPEIKIMMRKVDPGPEFTIEMEDFLKLNVPNIDEEKIEPSLLYVYGYGELNIYDYPSRRIRPETTTVKVIKGVYIICGSSEGSNICSYESAYGYRELARVNGFKEGFDADSKIVVFLNSFTRSLNANLGYLRSQKIQFIRRVSNLPGILDDEIEEEPKVRFTNASELTSKADSTTELSGYGGGVLLDNVDSDLFIVGFEENLTIKQEGDLSSNNATSITVQPMSEKVRIFIDDSVDIYKQKLKIESDNENPIDVTLVTNKDVTSEELLKNFIETNDKKININIGESSPSRKKKNGIPIGAIVGIIVGVIAVVAVVVATVIVVVKKKKSEIILSYSDVNELDDSTF